MVKALLEKGWARFDYDPAVANWVQTVLPAASVVASDPDWQARWLVCEGTWFVGVDALPNDAHGAVPEGPPICGQAWDTATSLYGDLPLHPAQVSVIYPGYPRPREGESDGAFRYRLKRDAAHVDGLSAEGPDRRRMLKERHAYILGIPLTDCSAEAGPMVVWEGSHHLMRTAFYEALSGIDPAKWDTVDLTDVYQTTRARAFVECPRVLVPARPGETYLVHRMALHGVAP